MLDIPHEAPMTISQWSNGALQQKIMLYLHKILKS